MATKPWLSVIIPAHNAAPYIGETIRSVLNQTVSEHEIIVVDDGSTDETADIVVGFGSQIRMIRQLNQGLSAARNSGIAAASGEWLAFLDADDLWLAGFCGGMLAQTKLLAKNIGVVTCGWRYIDAVGHEIGALVRPSDGETTLQQLLLGNRFPLMAAIVHTSWINRVTGFDPRINGVQDWDFWLRLAYAGCKFHSFPDVLVSYRQVPGSMSRHVEMMRNNGMIVLDNLYGQPKISPEMIALRAKAYGLVKLWAGANFYEAGYSENGFREFRDALIDHPGLFSELETFHAIICAEQPRHFKGTAVNLDIRAAEKRLQAILSAAAQHLSAPPPSLQCKAEMLGYRTLAEYSFRQGHRRQTLRYVMHSLRLADDCSAIKQGTRLIAKAIVQPIPKESENDLFAPS